LLSVLRPGGILLCSVRDYERIDRSATSTHPYGTRWRGDVEYRLRQDWVWRDAAHYDATMVIEEKRADDWREVVRTMMTYYAVPIARLMELMREAGFVGVTRDDAMLYQPVLIGIGSSTDVDSSSGQRGAMNSGSLGTPRCAEERGGDSPENPDGSNRVKPRGRPRTPSGLAPTALAR
jgi:hypothetical protein